MVNEKHNILNEDELDKLSLNMNGENVKLEDLGLTFQYSPSSRYGLVKPNYFKKPWSSSSFYIRKELFGHPKIVP